MAHLILLLVHLSFDKNSLGDELNIRRTELHVKNKKNR